MSTTTTDTCWCGAEAVLFAVGGDQPPQQWCEEHQPDDPYEPDFTPDLSDEPAAPAPAPAVAASRGLLWLSEICRDLDLEVAALGWESFSRPRHRVQVRDLAGLGVLGDRLGLDPVEVDDHLAWRRGTWADMDIKVFCGVEA